MSAFINSGHSILVSVGSLTGSYRPQAVENGINEAYFSAAVSLTVRFN